MESATGERPSVDLYPKLLPVYAALTLRKKPHLEIDRLFFQRYSQSHPIRNPWRDPDEIPPLPTIFFHYNLPLGTVDRLVLAHRKIVDVPFPIHGLEGRTPMEIPSQEFSAATPPFPPPAAEKPVYKILIESKTKFPEDRLKIKGPKEIIRSISPAEMARSEMVILPPLISITQDCVCLIDLLEPLLALWTPIGVIFQSQFPEGFLYLLIRGILAHAQYAVVVLFAHLSSAILPC